MGMFASVPIPKAGGCVPHSGTAIGHAFQRLSARFCFLHPLMRLRLQQLRNGCLQHHPGGHAKVFCTVVQCVSCCRVCCAVLPVPRRGYEDPTPMHLPVLMHACILHIPMCMAGCAASHARHSTPALSWGLGRLLQHPGTRGALCEHKGHPIRRSPLELPASLVASCPVHSY